MALSLIDFSIFFSGIYNLAEVLVLFMCKRMYSKDIIFDNLSVITRVMIKKAHFGLFGILYLLKIIPKDRYFGESYVSKVSKGMLSNVQCFRIDTMF